MNGPITDESFTNLRDKVKIAHLYEQPLFIPNEQMLDLLLALTELRARRDVLRELQGAA
ncbi:MAG: hypothetical protein RL684_1966 [Pseudomonadota bacterium]|jgi:hypothetical protein